jgi:hypothetical protein
MLCCSQTWLNPACNRGNSLDAVVKTLGHSTFHSCIHLLVWWHPQGLLNFHVQRISLIFARTEPDQTDSSWPGTEMWGISLCHPLLLQLLSSSTCASIQIPSHPTMHILLLLETLMCSLQVSVQKTNSLQRAFWIVKLMAIEKLWRWMWW